MNVVILTENLVFGGINRYCLDLVDGLRRYRDLRVCLLAPQNSKDKWLIEEAEKIGVTVETTSGKRVSAVNELYKIFKNIQPDILHTQGYYSNVIGRLTVRMHRMPITLVNTVHGIYHFSSAVFRSRLWYALDYLTMFTSNRVIAVSKTTARQIKWLRLKNHPIVIHNGTNLKVNSKENTRLDIRRKFGISENWGVVCFVGRFSPQKGIRNLVEVMQKTLQRSQDIAFVIVGDGELRPIVEACALDFPGHVFVTGQQECVSDFYVASDVLLLPSITEGLPMTVIEAFAHGLPVVASKVGGVPEIVKDSYNGFLCDQFDTEEMSRCILRILEDAQLRSELGINARTAVEKDFSLESMTQQTYQVYRDLFETIR